jgi:dTMP kinase
MFVVFEGIDGSGKTTISNRVAAELAREGLAVKHLREGGRFASPVSEGIRDFGRNAQNLDLSWQAEFLLYVARDVQLIHEALRPALGSHDLILADRFLYTPEVLARYGRGLADSFTRPILNAAADGVEPDLVILVDVDPSLARARRKLRKLRDPHPKPPSRKGLSGAGLQQRLRRGYLALADEQRASWVVLENRGSLEASVQRALALIVEARRAGSPRAVARFRAETGRVAAPAPRALSDPGQALSAFLSLVDELSEREPRVAAYLLGGMHGSVVDERRRQLLERAPDAVLAALDDLADDESFRLRRAAASHYPGLALRSLGDALDTAQGWQLWQALASQAPAEALFSASGLNDARAWQARESWFESAPELQELSVGSLFGLDDERAWSLRQRLLSARSAQLETSYELARCLARSVTGLGSERAWQLRRATRRLAPVAALASLAGVTDAESWRWRGESLRAAPKVVMSTLLGALEPAAWQMREQAVADCKEALDGLQNLDAARAWALREGSRDVWPSTVVKVLGALADSARGQALIARQLGLYPDNLSLLKHVSSIALGLHLPAASPAALAP